MFGQVCDLALLVADVISENVHDEGENFFCDTLANIVSELFVENHHEETAKAHELVQGFAFALVVLVGDHVSHIFHGFPVVHFIHLDFPQLVEIEFYCGQVDHQWLVKLLKAPPSS